MSKNTFGPQIAGFLAVGAVFVYLAMTNSEEQAGDHKKTKPAKEKGAIEVSYSDKSRKVVTDAIQNADSHTIKNEFWENYPHHELIQGKVRHVVDGDSIYIGTLKTQIRLWGVDAPERDERGYDAAKNKLTTMVMGRNITCAQVERDKYDRIIARCIGSEPDEINYRMIESGKADEYCRFTDGYYGFCG